jgi:hypothetical protein
LKEYTIESKVIVESKEYVEENNFQHLYSFKDGFYYYILESDNLSPLEYYYLVDRNINLFKEELNNFIGAICRKYFHGFEQKKERYKDLREDAFVFVLSCLDGLNSEKYKFHKFKLNRKGIVVESKFLSYLHLLIRWILSNYFRRFNKKRKVEVSYEQALSVQQVILKNINSINLYTDKCLEFSTKYNLGLNKDEILLFIHFNTKNTEGKEELNKLFKKYKYEFKLLSWMLFKEIRNYL